MTEEGIGLDILGNDRTLLRISAESACSRMEQRMFDHRDEMVLCGPRKRAWCDFLLIPILIAVGGSVMVTQLRAQTPGQAPPSAPPPATAVPCYLQSGAARANPRNAPASTLSSPETDSILQENTSLLDDSVEAVGADAKDYPPMGAGQIVDILEQNPDALASIKNALGQKSGIDPATISDDGIYNCIRQDPGFRSQVSRNLTDLGYVSDSESGETPTEPARDQGSDKLALPSRRPTPGTVRPEVEPPSEVRKQRRIPYPNLPSLPDLY